MYQWVISPPNSASQLVVVARTGGARKVERSRLTFTKCQAHVFGAMDTTLIQSALQALWRHRQMCMHACKQRNNVRHTHVTYISDIYATHACDIYATHDDACWMCRYQEDAAREGRNEVPSVATFRKPFVNCHTASPA